jgi:hypothetical protein
MDSYENFRKKNLKDMFKTFFKLSLVCFILQTILVTIELFLPEKMNLWDFAHVIVWGLFGAFSFYKYKKIEIDDTNE